MAALSKGSINRKPVGIFFVCMLLVLALFTVILPNSVQIATAVAMIFCAFISFFYIEKTDVSAKYSLFIYLNVFVTLIYLFVGVTNSAPNEAVRQVFIIYIISPVLWFLILTVLLTRFGEKKLISFFIPMAWLCCFSVLIFFYLYENYGASSVSLFKENANINTNDGFSGANMHVYGSLIFISGGFFAAPDVVKNKLIMMFTLAVLVFAAITSGRTALIISLFIGFFVFLSFSSSSSISFKARLGVMISLMLGVFLVIYVGSVFRNIDIHIIMDIVTDKISSGGGTERSIQSKKLVESFFDNYGIGVGHGIGVDYIRSYSFPWRYETVWWATLHRVGIVGSTIYLMPFVFYLVATFLKFIKKGLSSSERFLLGGFLCAFAASNTNPYLEGVPFQWMYILPVLALLIRSKGFKG